MQAKKEWGEHGREACCRLGMGEQAGDEVGLDKAAGLRWGEMMHRARVWCNCPGGWGHSGGLPWLLRPCGGAVEMGDGLDKGEEACAMEKWGCCA